MDENFKRRLQDRFEGYELVELLDIPIQFIIDSFEDLIVENEEYLREFTEIGK